MYHVTVFSAQVGVLQLGVYEFVEEVPRALPELFDPRLRVFGN